MANTTISLGSVVFYPHLAEIRDREDQAKASYNYPLRRSNHVLSEENMRLKRILRENGIFWSPISRAHIQQTSTRSRRGTRNSRRLDELELPRLPTAVISRIVKCALQSPHPIIDPLSRTVRENLTGPERSRSNQIAIHILATCRALHEEGTRYLWESNTFVFTTPEALRHFAELSPEHRNKVTSVNLRVIARYYDDRQRSYRLEEDFWPDRYGKPPQLVNTLSRPKESRPIRGGFRSYSGYQLADFLKALRAPYDPNYQDKHIPRPRLLPSLSLLRLDFVNFIGRMWHVSFSNSEVHELACHELGCTLNELQITGLPTLPSRIPQDLSSMLKDEGVFLEGCATYVAGKRQLQKLACRKWVARVVRASVSNLTDPNSHDNHVHDPLHFHACVHRPGMLPPAPTEEDHPTSLRDQDKVIWKQVPFTRDSELRRWALFSRADGHEMPETELYAAENGRCSDCGINSRYWVLRRHSEVLRG
ncbi:hypothetical protein E4U13_004355 [Claviceps humidiphila]|uniref:Uncharacterized protein n=1 Tax=Claviceps humidiphila TaxID=1294629 RepID=A0A9P7TWC9_9HYPO|nr:hypothetical protein E4U13_004355 [Claviceps humidiphila]